MKPKIDPHAPPKDGRFYLLPDDPNDPWPSCHVYRGWDAKWGRYQDQIKPLGMIALTRRDQPISQPQAPSILPADHDFS